MDQDYSIAKEIKNLEVFGSALDAFFQQCEEKNLFKRIPPKETPEAAAKRLAEGHYLMRPCGCKFHPEETGTIALELFELLKTHLPEREEDLALIQDTFVSGKTEVVDFLASVFSNIDEDIAKIISEYNLAEDLTTFFAVYLARPFRAKAARMLTEELDLEVWHYGYCPVCGHWASLSHIANKEENRRTMWCLHCGTHWRFPRIKCAYCLNDDHESLEIVSPVSEESFRIQVCKKCRRYIKEIRSDNPINQISFDTVYLGMAALDYSAKDEGCVQDSLLTVRYDNPKGNKLLLYRQKTNSHESQMKAV